MLRKGIRPGIAAALGAFAALSLGPVPAEAAVEVRVGFGVWTLEPLRSTIESRCEKMIESEFFKLLNSVLPEWVLTPVQTTIDSSSSGRAFFAEVWLPVGRSRFAVGLRGDFFDFKIPYTASAAETIQIFGVPLAELSARGAGTVNLGGFGISLLGRWKAIAGRRFELALRAGGSAYPFRGTIEMDQTLLAETLLGDLSFSGRLDESIAAIRGDSDDVPAWIFAPAAGLDIGYRLDARLRLFASASVSHGTLLAAGISASF